MHRRDPLGREGSLDTGRCDEQGRRTLSPAHRNGQRRTNKLCLSHADHRDFSAERFEEMRAKSRPVRAQPNVAINDHNLRLRSAGDHTEQTRQLAAIELAGLVVADVINCGYGFRVGRCRVPAMEPDTGGDGEPVAVIDVDGGDEMLIQRSTLDFGKVIP